MFLKKYDIFSNGLLIFLKKTHLTKKDNRLVKAGYKTKKVYLV